MAPEDQRRKKWLPLEANPEVMEQFLLPLGFPEKAGFHDIYGLDEELLAMVPTPVFAVLLLYPIDDAAEEAKKAEIERLEKEGQTGSDRVWFTLQTVGNACGTVGLLHAIGNNTKNLKLKEDSYLKKFFQKTENLNAAERAKFLEDDTEMEDAHSVAASGGDTAPPDITESVNLHFVTFVTVEGGLYELDGSKPFPIYHGPSTPDDLLPASIKVVRNFMERNPNSVQFNLIAMCGES